MGFARTAFGAIGTHWDIQVSESETDGAWAELLGTIRGRIDEFDAAYSRFRGDSLVSRMSQRAGTYELPEDGYGLLRFYEQLYRVTGGKVTPLIGQVVSDAGYDAAYSFQSKPLQTPPAWDDVISYDELSITLKQSALLDFGAAGKGYLVDIVSEIIAEAGVRSYAINAGGDILHRSGEGQTLKVGLENPLDAEEAIGTVQLANESLCASAGSKRKWGGYHHIIDPTTLRSTDEILATWVIAGDTMTADGLATALFFMKPEELAQQFTFSYAVLHQDMSMQYDKKLPINLFEA
jgi:thiamine biosynthesis lipoprotein